MPRAALVDFEVGYTNPSSERMMGVRLGDEVGARLREVMPGVVPMGLYDRLLRVAETREAESAEITLDTMWRDAIHVRGVWVHTVLPFGSGLLSVAFDVSEERRRENELRDFAAVAAHDLREPLLGVHVMASLLGRRGGLGVEEQEMVRLLDDGVKRATGLVDSILEYATATDDGASRTEVDCGEVVSEVVVHVGVADRTRRRARRGRRASDAAGQPSRIVPRLSEPHRQRLQVSQTATHRT